MDLTIHVSKALGSLLIQISRVHAVAQTFAAYSYLISLKNFSGSWNDSE
ncbi:MAG: hypothetical protein IKX94_08490 [Muribaculaceae bacterium]|nr:hypothetical protein [Muribaculaceae bacterium]